MILNDEQQNKEVLKHFQQILGAENVLYEKEDRYIYAVDSTAVSTDTYLPDYVLFVHSTQEVSEVLKIANKYEIPVTVRGAATNMAGCCVPTKGGVVLVTTKMDKILEIDAQNQTCKVQPGVIVVDLQTAVGKEGLTYPPDPSNLKVSTIGGSLALSSSGPRTFKYGGTKDYVIDLEVVLAEGSIMRTAKPTIKNVTGYNLTQLFVGSEGTLGVITEATFRLIPSPETNKIMLAYFNTIDDAANAINGIISAKLTPSVLDIIDKTTMQTIENFKPSGFLTEMEAVLFIEVDGYNEVIDRQINHITEICKQFGSPVQRIANTKEETENIWTARRAAFPAISQLRPNVLSEDMVVPREKMPEMIKQTMLIAKKNGVPVYIVGHAGDGNFHPHYAFDLRDKEETQRVENAIKEVFKKSVELGGTISGEHGIGLVKQKYMKTAVDPLALSYMKQIKALFDPKNILNPDKGL